MHMTSACRIPPIRPKILMNLAKQKTWPRLTWEIKPEIWIILNASCLAFLFGAPPTQTMASNYGASQIRLSNNSVCARRSTKCEECEPDEHGAFRNVVQLGNWGKIGKIGVAWSMQSIFRQYYHYDFMGWAITDGIQHSRSPKKTKTTFEPPISQAIKYTQKYK